jgi:hypothetical protein
MLPVLRSPMLAELGTGRWSGGHPLGALRHLAAFGPAAPLLVALVDEHIAR